MMENTYEDLSIENWSFEESTFIKMTIRAPKRAQSMAEALDFRGRRVDMACLVVLLPP